MPIKLYELTDSIRRLGEIEDPDELQGTLESLDFQFKEKALNIAKFYLELAAEDKALETEINRLTDKRRAIINKAAYFKKYLQENMITSGIDKIEDTVVKLSIRTNPPSCEVSDVLKLPENFRKVIPESWIVDRVAILKHVKQTGEIPEGVTITNNKRLEIR